MNMNDMDLQWENMRAGIEAQVPFVRDGARASFQQAQEKLGGLAMPSRIYLVGCGDSWYCGLATRLAFESWVGVPTESVQAMEFSRYLIDFAPADSLVIAVSNSGRVARTVECVARARARGMATIALTSNQDSPISREADHVIDLGYAERRFGPGTSSYMASLINLYTIALFLGQHSGRLTPGEAEQKLNEISSLADGMQQTLDAIDGPLADLAPRVPFEAHICFLGAGPNYGTAFFAMAKMIEAAQHNTVGQELEEWAHEQYFVTGPGAYTFVLAPRGAGLDRAREQLYAIRAVGGYAIAVCEPDDEETQALADLSLPVFGQPDELLSPILYCLAGELFALHFAQSRQLVMLGFNDEQRKQVNFQQIFDSKIVS
jgi:glutamine---fructose-6-phosphate transaminase (isomerizing)